MKNFLILSTLLMLFSYCTHTENKTVATMSASDSLLLAQHETEEANKKLVVDFYQRLFGDKDISVVDSVLVENYIQHNPSVVDGREALKTALTGWFKGAAKEKVDIQRVIADGDLVMLHVRSVIMGKTSSIVDIFRLKDGKIVEHWDVMQEVPQNAVNPHPMF